MQPLELGKFVVQILQWFWDRLIFFTECKKGEAVIKRRCGFPVKWRNRPRWYFKWPIIDMFDKVDMRKKYVQFNAHSFHGLNMEKGLIPYNIIIDFQVEYQVVNPLVIYDEYGFAQGESEYLSFINNTVQKDISKLICEKGIELTYKEIISYFEEKVKEYKKSTPCSSKIKEFDNSFRAKRRRNYFIEPNDGVSINDIIITSFDKNISLRTTV